jgi:hypothetical protein
MVMNAGGPKDEFGRGRVSAVQIGGTGESF